MWSYVRDDKGGNSSSSVVVMAPITGPALQFRVLLALIYMIVLNHNLDFCTVVDDRIINTKIKS